MSTFGEDLIQSLGEAIAHAKGNGPAILHTPVTPRAVRKQVNLTQAQMASLMGMSLSGYRKWEQGTRRVNGPAVSLLHVIARNRKRSSARCCPRSGCRLPFQNKRVVWRP